MSRQSAARASSRLILVRPIKSVALKNKVTSHTELPPAFLPQLYYQGEAWEPRQACSGAPAAKDKVGEQSRLFRAHKQRGPAAGACNFCGLKQDHFFAESTAR